MSKKKGSFLDQHLDKLIFGLAGVAGLYLLWALVLSNPYGKSVGGRKYGPSDIDRSNQEESQRILEKLQESAKTNPYLQNKTAELTQKMTCSVPHLSIAANWPIPTIGTGDQSLEDRIYTIPAVPGMENIKLVSVRGAVRMPTEDVSPERPYSAVASQAADLDLVTISAHINMQSLLNNFQQSFNGPRLKPQWKDPTYAEPVFARLEMQRRVQNSDGSWGDWETVPVIKINPYQKMYKDLPLTTDQMTFGDVMLFLNQYKNNFAMIKNILQPEPYQFLSSRMKWMAPEFYDEIQKLKEEEDQKKMREERDRRQAERERSKAVNRPTPGGMGGGMPQMQPQPQTQPGRRGGRQQNDPGMMGIDPMMGMEGTQPAQRQAKPVRTSTDVEKDYNAALIGEKTKVNTLKDLFVWIHDDSAKPGSTYQYRVRYGVFNPIAGKNWFAPESKQYQAHIVLWSPFMELPDPVVVPKMLHMFPTDVLANNSGVKVEVYKYYLGQWRTESFDIQPGQIIGKQIESKPKAPAGAGMGMMGMDPMMGMGEQASALLVDFSTGNMLVDVVSTLDWQGTSYRQPRSYPQMLYIDENNQMLALAARKQFWPKEVTADYNAVKQEMAQSTGQTDTMMMPMEGMPMEGMPMNPTIF